MLALLANQIQLFPVGLVVGATHLEDGKLVGPCRDHGEANPGIARRADRHRSRPARSHHLELVGDGRSKGTPESIIQLLDQAVVAALSDPNVVERFAALGLLVPTQTQRAIRGEPGT